MPVVSFTSFVIELTPHLSLVFDFLGEHNLQRKDACSTVKSCPAITVCIGDWYLPHLVFFVSCQCLRMAEEEVEKMAAIAEQEKLKNINMEKQLQASGPLSTYSPVPSPVSDLQQALQEKDK